MPEPMAMKRVLQKRGHAQPIQQSIPTPALEVPEEPAQETEHVSIFHLVCAVQEMVHALGVLINKVDALVIDNAKQRNFVDTPVQIGATIGYTVNYLDRKFLFVYSTAGVTLLATDGSTKTVAAHTWVNISYPRGTILLIQGGSDVTPALLTVRACDFMLSTN